MSSTTTNPLRTVVVQPTLAKYRVPVYRELASRPGIDLQLWYGNHDTIKNADPDGFSAQEKALRTFRLGGQEILWHQAQLDAVRSDQTDVVVLSWGSRYLSLGPALREAKRRGKAIVLWGHGYSKNDNTIKRWARDRIAKLADVLMFYDADTAQAAIDTGWPEDRIFVAPNAIDQKPIAAAREACLADPSAREAFLAEQDLQDKRLLLYVSRFTPENCLDLLVEAIDLLRKRKPEVVVALVGGGEDFDRIEQMVAEYGLEEHMRLLGPIYDESTLAHWFTAAEAFVYPAAIGLSLYHAFGYGLPVVTDDSSTGHNPEIIAYVPDEGSEAQNGIAYHAGDQEHLAEQLERLLGDDALREKLSRNALSTVQTQFNIPAMVDGMEAAICRSYELRS